MRVNRISARRMSAAKAAGDGPRALLACVFLFALCVSAGFVAHGYKASPDPTSRSAAGSDESLRTGSILIVTPTGNLCRESSIDNTTGRIQSNGWVDCDEALAKAANTAAGSRSQGSRLDLIREGFRGRS
jgi:hypothetical protein